MWKKLLHGLSRGLSIKSSAGMTRKKYKEPHIKNWKTNYKEYKQPIVHLSFTIVHFCKNERSNPHQSWKKYLIVHILSEDLTHEISYIKQPLFCKAAPGI